MITVKAATLDGISYNGLIYFRFRVLPWEPWGEAALYLFRNNANFITLLALSLLLATLSFVFDLVTPLGVAAGVPYVALVMLGLWFPRREHVLLLGAIGTVLTLAGYALSPSGGVLWVVLANRMLAIFAIWITAILIYRYGGMAIERKNLSRAVEQAPVGVIITDNCGIIEYANPKMLEMSGYEMTDIIGNTPRVFKSEITNPETHGDLWQTITSGKEWRGEMVNMAKDGSLFWEDVFISPVFGRNGNIRNFIGIKESITNRKRVEEELAMTLQKAEMASVAKSKFLSNMSHELRTPLNAIIGFSEAMELQVLGPMKNKKYLDYATGIRESADHLRDLIDTVLDLAKVESGKESLNEEDMDVSRLLHVCQSLVASLAEKGGVSITVNEKYTDESIRGDSQKIRQVLLNLLSNAIKFTPDGGEVCIRSYKKQDNIFVIEVKDNGVGIPPESHEKVFDEFEQVENKMSGSIKGTGLGLPLSLRLMKMHGGDIEMDSALGQGTTMRMVIPARRVG